MSQHSIYHYNDDKLTGLAIAEMIAREWATGRYGSIAEVTSAIHQQRSELPRSAIFWLAYHTLTDSPERGKGSGSSSG